MLDVAVIGAGPYGLSIGAHLAARGARLGVFGPPMETWRTQMPDGMRLKSEGFASSLYDPLGAFSLARYCAEFGLPYAPVGLPVERRIFVDYGREFARRHVPSLEPRMVTELHQERGTFVLRMGDGATVAARQVVCAAGISHFAYLPQAFAEIAPALLSHASAHADFSRFKGAEVAVVGGGASAADCAALLVEAGARVHLITRRAGIVFHEPPRRRGLKDRLRAPRSGIGTSWESVFFERAPLLFHALPVRWRMDMTRQFAGPAAGWFVRQQVEAHVTLHARAAVARIGEAEGRAVIGFAGGDAPDLAVDHVIAATGYRADIERLGFIAPDLRRRIARAGGAPALSRSFQSSVPGLYFAGPAAANSFGPLQRFACGARFAARRLARAIC